jgi:hypothetical protein
MVYCQARVRALAIQDLAEPFIGSDQNKLLRTLRCSQECSGNDGFRSVITTHGIDRNSHGRMPLALRL